MDRQEDPARHVGHRAEFRIGRVTCECGVTWVPTVPVHFRFEEAVQEASAHRVEVSLMASEKLNDCMQDVERQILRSFRSRGLRFEQMAEILLGDQRAARKVQLRYNQLGLRIRDER